MLILFDIDGTLLLTGGAGVAAMGDAGREMFGPHFTMEGIEFSGRLDTLIWDDLVRLNNVPEHARDHDRFREMYGRKLTELLEANRVSRLLPGVAELVNRLDELDQVTLGLVTGNYPETGRLKIHHAGIDPDVFVVAAWGCEGACRRDLPPLAMSRHAAASGSAIPPHHVIVIGDTPHDIDCAQANGCRSIGVATGQFTVEALWRAGADLAVEDLGETEEILEWIMTAGRQTHALGQRPVRKMS